ncbi:MAG TPA: M20/M25/M40 family metallo-hydrolase [Planctomycetota bacterium]|nr:M20/M25/M40 family metallo-hydrolase [Planctomycetota bacterium]
MLPRTSLALVPFLLAFPQAPSDSAKRMADDVRWLAAPEREGRKAGSPAADASAEWIAKRFESLGLKPAGDSGWFQEFALPTGRIVDHDASVDVRKPGEDLSMRVVGAKAGATPTLAGAAGRVEAPALWLPDSLDAATSHVDSPHIAIAKKRAGNAVADPVAQAHGMPTTSIRSLAFRAKQRGAIGLVVFVDDEAKVGVEDGDSRDVGLPVVIASFAIPPIDDGDIVTIDSGLSRVDRKTRNVLAMLPGATPDAEVIVLGAHYDHLGLGGSDSLAPGERAIHPGADDNASGTALLLELARRLAPKKGKLDRAVLFAAWGGEEMGLLGSAHWTKNATIPFERVAANLNFDMVGRAKDRKLDVGSTASSSVWPKLVESANREAGEKLSLRTSSRLRGVGGSDHMSFLAANKPALFFFSGLHDDYHKPSDTADKIAAEPMADLADVVERLVPALAREPKIDYVAPPKPPAESSPSSSSAESGMRASLGTIPDYGAEGDGMVIAGVSAGGAAEKAGLKKGDVLVKLGIFKIGDVYDLTEALARLKPGEEVDVDFVRDGAKKSVKAVLGRRGGG